MGWDEQVRFTATRPSPTGLARMAVTVGGASARVVRVRRLAGGVDASTHEVVIEPGGPVVVKRSWTLDARSLRDEFDRLGVAEAVPVATPRPLALDADGDWFGRPALVMSRVPGGPRFHDRPGRWIGDLAEVLLSVHSTALPATLPAVMATPHAGAAWRPAPPSRLRRTPRIVALIEAAQNLQTDLVHAPGQQALLHHDFHHGNVTWWRDRPVGVVDWNEACIGPPVCDVAYCSVDLAMTHGPGAADQLTSAYRAAGGRTEDLARWQALWIANDLRWLRYWVVGLQAAGGTHLGLPTLRRRLHTYADHVLTRL